MHQSKTIQLLATRKQDLIVAKDILAREGLVALPTETVYGLAANGLSPKAILKVFAAKDRPANNPLILHTDTAEKALQLFDVSQFSPIVLSRFDRLAQKFWPGPLTIIAPKNGHIPLEATAGLSHVAVRIPNNDATNKILSMLDFPLVMPSANLSTRPSPTCAMHVLKTLDGRIDAVLDDGPSLVGIESTVVRIDKDFVEILRPGMIDQEQLEACLDESVKFSQKTSTPQCPGQSFLHYSPKVSKVALCSHQSIDKRWPTDDVIIATKNDFSQKETALGMRPKDSINIILSDEPALYAKGLYDALYLAENSPEKQLSILEPKDSHRFLAVIDRIARASSLKSNFFS